MADWPLEVGRVELLPAACAAYDAADDDLLRFDLMALALASTPHDLAPPWFAPRLVRDAALLGHLIRDAAYFEVGGAPCDDDAELPALTPVMRRAWRDALTPIALGQRAST